ncbi:MAG: VWA domain-containing protein [Myxococcota bacterium]|nr:VWA domain-containing protein [Myxococcota bacterium]
MVAKVVGRHTSWPLLLGGFLLTLFSVGPETAWATHAATTNGEIENRPAPVFRRVCLSGTNDGDYCKQDSECPGSACADRNVYNITVAVLYDAPAADITSIQTLITAMSTELFDATDGQAEIGIATIHNDAISTNQADLVIHPSTNPTWWQADSGHYRIGGFMEVSINNVTNPANQGDVLAHEFSHLVFDMRDEYEDRQPNCGPIIKQCAGGANPGNNCVAAADCPGSDCVNIGDCPVPAAGAAETCLMDGNGSEYCWGQGDPTDLTDLSGGNHDPTNDTEQSSCRGNRSCWAQLAWSWPDTILMPTGAPDAAANGKTVKTPNFVLTDDTVRVVLVLDESGSMDEESPTRMQRLQVAANDFIATAENDTEVGIVSFSTNADPANGYASVAIAALGNNRTNWTNAIAGLGTDGWTNIGDGLAKAKAMIVAAGGVTANTYVLLMTDGRNNRPEPQATADADLNAKIADLLASNIPVYVTCTGGDLGLQSQCAEIGSGTGGFHADSADAAKLPENFVDFHERMTGHQSIDSIYGNFAKIAAASPKTIFVDEGSESVSFALLWDDAAADASMSVVDPNGVTHQSRAIPQGRYVRIASPTPGDWIMRIDPAADAATQFVARAYTQNRINNFTASLRQPVVEPNDELYVYAIARSIGGTVTREGEKLTAVVTLPNGATDTVDLFDNGRDALGHGDDMAGDGIFTGVFTNTAQKGAYSFHFRAEVEDWVRGEEAHQRDERLSPRFVREVRLSAGVGDPTEPVVKPEDEEDTPGTAPGDDPNLQTIKWLLYVIVILLLIGLYMIWYCCRKGRLAVTHVE